MIRVFAGLVALLILAGPVRAADPVMTAEQKAQTDYAISRGQQIYILDRAAWVATDAMYEQLPKRDQLQIKGWIVEVEGDDEVVRFYGMARGKPYWIYVAQVRSGAVFAGRKATGAERSAVTPIQRRMVTAVGIAGDTARKEKFLTCAPGPFNTVVIPPASETGAVEVYLLTPQTEAKVYPFGGHHKVVVAANGTVTFRPYTKGCVNLSTAYGDDKVVSFGIGHFLDPAPTEIHVFTVLTSKTPVVVVTDDDSVWAVGSSAIRYDGKRAPQEKPAPKAQ